MKKLAKITGTLIAATSLAGPASAIHTGSIETNLDTSTFYFDDTMVDFDQGANGSGVINDATGDFSGWIGEKILYKDFDYMNFPDGGIMNLWSVLGSSTSFSLTDLSFIDYDAPQSGGTFLNLAGTGVFHMDGQEDAWSSWSLSADERGGVYNFSATNIVPDTGATHALLGAGLFGLIALSRARKFKSTRS